MSSSQAGSLINGAGRPVLSGVGSSVCLGAQYSVAAGISACSSLGDSLPARDLGVSSPSPQYIVPSSLLRTCAVSWSAVSMLKTWSLSELIYRRNMLIMLCSEWCQHRSRIRSRLVHGACFLLRWLWGHAMACPTRNCLGLARPHDRGHLDSARESTMASNERPGRSGEASNIQAPYYSRRCKDPR